MNKKILTIFASILTLTAFTLTSDIVYSANATKTIPSAQYKTTINANQNGVIKVKSLDVVANPQKYLNKTIKMEAKFDKFSTLGLDYSKAKRESTKYIGILIQRDDIVDHNIPLSEMKLFMKKEMAEKFIDLDTGDIIELTAKVFSAALGDPWLDIENLKIIKKVQKEENK